MEDNDEGERKTVTISFEVYEEDFNAGNRAVLDTLIERLRFDGRSDIDCLGVFLHSLVYEYADSALGEEEVNRIECEALGQEKGVPPPVGIQGVFDPD